MVLRPEVSLKDIFQATVMAKILYCAPAWFGFCPAADRAKLDAFLRRCKRSSYCELSVPTVAELFTDADNKNHVMQTFLPEPQALAYSLRVKTHNKALIDKTADLNERNFLICVLHKDCY